MSTTMQLVIRDRRTFAQGHSFDDVGPYEAIHARALFRFDPTAPEQAGVFDIDLAPRGDDGLVPAATDVWILKPVDLSKGNGAALVEFPNRGNKRCLQFFNDAPGTNDTIHTVRCRERLSDAPGLHDRRGGLAGRCVAGR